MNEKMKGLYRPAILILILILMSGMFFMLTGCNMEFERINLHGEIFDMQGNQIFNRDWHTYEYTGAPIDFRVDLIHTDKEYRIVKDEEIQIGIRHRGKKWGGGWQTDDFVWPSEVGSYSVKIYYHDETVVLFNDREYNLYERFDLQFNYVIEEKKI